MFSTIQRCLIHNRYLSILHSSSRTIGQLNTLPTVTTTSRKPANSLCVPSQSDLSQITSSRPLSNKLISYLDPSCCQIKNSNYFQTLVTIPTAITLTTHLESYWYPSRVSNIHFEDHSASNTVQSRNDQPQPYKSSIAFRPTLSLRNHPNCTLPPSNQLTEFEFRTIAPSSIPDEPTLLKEKGSKFINYCHYVENDNDVKNALDEIRSVHPRATHWCYAYRIGPRGEDNRANDDGEPSGSAGMPILGQLQSYDITNALVTVVRYYGGTKLGVSGLIKAYKEGAQSVLDECDIVIKELECEIKVGFDNHEDQNTIFTMMGQYNAEIVSFDCWDDIQHEEFDQKGWDREMELSKLHPSLKPPQEPMPMHEYVIQTRVKLKQKQAVLDSLKELGDDISIRSS